MHRGSFAACLLAASLIGCASGSGGSTSGSMDEAYGAASAEEAVEGFVEAARVRDYRTMAGLFGTPDGPAVGRLGRAQVEQRMLVLASLMEHRSHRIRPASLSEGPDRVRLMVELSGGRADQVAVPVVAAQHGSRWFVERVVTEPLTR